ncbi:MAG: TRAP transporter small permease, partial [Rhizobiaceae bacterium]|nr:TRAP transporter small permease [Rhizobiaceae bacterium]
IAAVMRFAGYPIIWSVDMAQLLFIWLCFLGATATMRRKGHIGVDLLVRMLGHKYRLWLETGQAALFIVFLSVLVVQGYLLAVANKERVFGYSGVSYYFVTIAVSVGCATLALAIIANVVDAWRERADGKTLIFSKTNGADTPSEL